MELELILEQYARGSTQVANDGGWNGAPVQYEVEPCAGYLRAEPGGCLRRQACPALATYVPYPRAVGAFE